MLQTNLQYVSAPTCFDGVKNQDETDMDCGGSICPKCANKKVCNLVSDCISGVCISNICQGKILFIWLWESIPLHVLAQSCTDGIKNQDETDTDCGGLTCQKCLDNKGCKVASDCYSGICTSNICQGNTVIVWCTKVTS